MTFLLGVFAVVIGAVVMRLGLRGRRVDDHPSAGGAGST
jgi:hypothetical protein